MHAVDADPRLAILAHLDVLDLTLEGDYELNGDFLAACRAAFQEDPRRFDRIIPEVILARALARGYALDLDLDELTLAALESAAA